MQEIYRSHNTSRTVNTNARHHHDALHIDTPLNIDWNAFQITYYELQPLIDIIINYFK